MVKHSLLLAVLVGLLLSAAGVAQAESSYSPVITVRASNIGAASAAANTAYFNQSNGTFTTATNWNTSSVPTSSINAYVGGSGGYTANLTAAASTNNLFLGTNASCPGVPSTSYEGPGTLNITNGTLSIANGLYVGYASTGTLSVSNGATVTTKTASYIGGDIASGNTSVGTVTVTGTGSKWTGSSSLSVGNYGPGYLNVTSGGSVTASAAAVGSSAVGTVTVDGFAGSTASTWTISGASSIGTQATGTSSVTITNGGYVDVTGAGTSYWGNNGTAGSSSLGPASLQVDGSGGGNASKLVIGAVNIGWSAAASVTISNGGTATMGGIVMGQYATGAGTMTIENGGTLTSGGATLGGVNTNGYAGTGQVFVDGSTSSWTQTAGAGLNIGWVDTGAGTYGKLHITNGATVTNTGTTYLGSRNNGASGLGNALLDFGATNGGTLTTQSLFASPTQITGTGTINANGLLTDGAVTFTAATGTNGLVSWSSPTGVTVNLSMPFGAATNGVLGAGFAGVGTLNISGETVTSSAGYLGYKLGSTGTAVVSGSGAGWTIGSGGTLYVGASGTTTYGTGNLYIVGGGAVTTPSVAIGSGSMAEIDVGLGSSLNVTNSGGATNSGTMEVLCGARPVVPNVYYPIHVGGTPGITGTVQAVGGTWSGGAFTVSNVVTGTLGSGTLIDTSVNQRALWNDGNGNALGASFVAATSSNFIDPIVTVDMPPPLSTNQFALGEWALSGVTASSANPVYLSLSNNPIFNVSSLWYSSNAGTSWTQITSSNAPDLTFDGSYYNFSLTGSAGNGLDFNGYDYAVVGTPALPGDANLDGRVDINDLTIVLGNYGKTGQAWTQGSMDGDPTGTVDINDLTIVLGAYGDTVAASGGIGMAAVPEPGALLLLAAGLVASLLAYARRK